VDAVFCCLPHATTQQIIKSLPRDLKVVGRGRARGVGVGAYE
jgi:hypothetical protein